MLNVQRSGVIAPCLMGEWIVVASEHEFAQKSCVETRLDGFTLSIHQVDQAHYQVQFHSTEMQSCLVQVQLKYGLIWICVGVDQKPIFELPEYDVPKARRVPCCIFGVHTSPLRGIENFLDMAHLPFVHTGILGEEPHTFVKPYKVDIREDVDEIWATDCFFMQPLAAPSSSQPQETEYIYRVVSPLNAVLYKINTEAQGIIPADVIGLFIQPIQETYIRAYMLMVLDDQVSSTTDMFLFQQKIFTQDKPILENHVPLKLPLEKMEIPTKADALASTYRKWLLAKNWQYGVHQMDIVEDVV